MWYYTSNQCFGSSEKTGNNRTEKTGGGGGSGGSGSGAAAAAAATVAAADNDGDENSDSCTWVNQVNWEQGKSEGFESCDWPIVRKRPIWVKIGDALYRVTLKFDWWPWKTTGHLSFAVSSFVQHFIAIGEFKLELQSGNAHFGSNSTIFRAMLPWNLTDDLEKQ